MRAEAVSWDDCSVSNPPPLADNDKWHVQFAPGEVKIVSVEQLDDLFRLSIVDSETQVWQAGMREWQPLRVIAGLDDEPAPEPKRAPPKPPTPSRAASPSVRPAPPAPRPATASVRPAPPPPRPATASVRPAPPPPRPSAPPPSARPMPLATASFYPEPILAQALSYPPVVQQAAPLAFAATAPAMNSVRPLVVSHVPAPPARSGSGFGRLLVGLALLGGVSVTAYRNDLLRDGAHAAHQDALYARLESALGGPAFGTLRALEQAAAVQPSLAVDTSEHGALRTAVAPSPASPAEGSAPAPAATHVSTTPVVSLESLAPEKKGLAAAAATLPTAAAPTPVRAAASLAQPKAVAPAAVKASPVKAATTPKAAVEKPASVAHKANSEMSERERLNAAIGQSMIKTEAPKAKSKAKAKANEYDPLNPNL